jgi:hypothetical protein
MGYKLPEDDHEGNFFEGLLWAFLIEFFVLIIIIAGVGLWKLVN